MEKKLVDEAIKSVSHVARLYEALCGLVGEQLSEFGEEKNKELLQAESLYHRTRPKVEILFSVIEKAKDEEEKTRSLKKQRILLDDAFAAVSDFVGLMST